MNSYNYTTLDFYYISDYIKSDSFQSFTLEILFRRNFHAIFIEFCLFTMLN